MLDTSTSDTSSALIYDPYAHQFLLLLRTEDAPRDPGMWSYFGGSIEAGESPVAAVKRELAEELNLRFKDVHLFYLASVQKPWGGLASQYLVLIRQSDHLLTLTEGAEMRWFPVHDALSIEKKTMELEHVLKVFMDKLSEAQRENYKHFLNL